MAEDHKLRQQAERGTRAKALLENELLQDAFHRLETDLIASWKTTEPEDAQRREDAWRTYRLLQNLKGSFTKLVTDGDYANKRLLELKTPLLQKVLR